MMAVVSLQTLEGRWDPCSSRVFFAGHEYDSLAESVAKARRMDEIDAMIERGDLQIPVNVVSPQAVQASFDKDLDELVKTANAKLEIVKLSSHFKPTEVMSLEEFAGKHNASVNDRMRELYKELTEFFISLQQPQTALRAHMRSADEPKVKNALPTKQPKDHLSEPVSKFETPLKGKPKKKAQQSPFIHTEDMDPGRFANLDTKCNVTGHCEVFESILDPEKGADSFWLRLGGDCSTGEVIQFGPLTPLATLNHPSLNLTVEPPTNDDEPRVIFEIGADSLVTLDCKALDDNIITDVFSKILLRLSEGLPNTMELLNYTLQLQNTVEAVEPPKKKAKRNTTVVVEPQGPYTYLSGDTAMLFLIEDIQTCVTADFKLGWNLTAEVLEGSEVCQLKVLGLSVFPAKKMKFTPGSLCQFGICIVTADETTEGN